MNGEALNQSGRDFRLLVLLAIFVAPLLLLAVAVSPAETQPSEPGGREEPSFSAPDRPEFVEGRILVKMKEGAPGNRLGEINRANNARVEERLPSIGVNVVDLPRDLPVQAAVNRYENAPGVEYAEPDYLLYLSETFTDEDPRFSDQYGLHNTGQTLLRDNVQVNGTPDADIDAPEAWDGGTVGKRDTVVAVIDSGVYTDHSDLKKNIWVNEDEIPDNGIDDDGNGYPDDVHGWDFYNNNTVYDNETCTRELHDGTTKTYDCDAHGTHVAGTIAAEGNNGTGVTGVNWQASIMPLKFIGPEGRAPSSYAAEAITYAVKNGAKISNNSYGYPESHPDLEPSQSLQEAISLAEDFGHLLVASAGNGGEDEEGDDNDAGPSVYPASYDNSNIISVAATDHSDELASFSNFGSSSVDLAAPGVLILSTLPDKLLGRDYDYMSGTSMASPHVAGVAALLKSQNPDLGAKELKSLILQSVDKVPDLDGKTVTGGRLNAANALALADPRTNVTNTNDAGPGSLRAAITAANANPDADTIEISTTGTVVLERELPELSTDIKIVGPGPDQFTVKRSEASGTPEFRIFTVRHGTVSISGLTVTNGLAQCNEEYMCGGGILNYYGTLTVDNSTITGNAVTHEWGSGGGIFNYDGRLEVTGSTISGNTAHSGGGIYSEENNYDDISLVVEDSTVSENIARQEGGGIYNEGGRFIIKNSTISENTSGYVGGGIYDSADATVDITGSTISGNVAGGRGWDGQGGGIYTYWYGIGRINIENSLISDNTADGEFSSGGGISVSSEYVVKGSTISGNTAGSGGGIESTSDSRGSFSNSTIVGNSAIREGGGIMSSADTKIEYSTIINNTAPEGKGGGVGHSSYSSFFASEPRISSSIIAGNTGSDVDKIDPDNRDDSNWFISEGYNLVGEGNVTGVFDQSGDQTSISVRQAFGTDTPLLDDNGGPTKTVAIQDGAQAIDAASPEGFPNTDQRGIKRPQGDGADIGAFELQSGSDPNPEPEPTPEPDPAELGVSPERLGFGRVAVGAREVRDVVLKNTGSEGSADIKVGSVSTEGNSEFSTPFKGNITLEPGQQRTFKVLFDPKRTGLKQGTLLIEHDGNNDSLQVPLVGRGVPNKRGCTIVSAPGQKAIRGTQGRDVICAGRGNHTIRGLKGDDTIYGGPGNDRLIGGPGNDRIFGGTGADKLYGQTGVDRLYGQGDPDFLNVRDRQGRDLANGGPGRDRCAIDRGDRKVSCP